MMAAIDDESRIFSILLDIEGSDLTGHCFNISVCLHLRRFK